VKDYVLIGVRAIIEMLFVISGISKIVGFPAIALVLRDLG